MYAEIQIPRDLALRHTAFQTIGAFMSDKFAPVAICPLIRTSDRHFGFSVSASMFLQGITDLYSNS